jgi:cytoskeleton protein RodZ
MSETAQSLGERLKAAREAAGMTAQKAADALHLDAWVVEALEGGDYSRVGPSVYVKGHMKRYAGLLGLPANEILALANDRPPSAAAAAASAPPQSQAPSLRLRASVPGPGPYGVRIAALVIIAGGIAAAYWRLPRVSFWAPKPAASATVPAAAAAPSAMAVPASTGSEGAGPTAEGADAPPTAAVPGAKGAAGASAGDGDALAGVGKAKLRLSFSADSWVYVRDAQGRRLFAGNGRANSVTTIAGDAPMRVYLGFASGVQVEVNNRVVAIGPQFIAGDVARFEAGADGVLRRDAHVTTAANRHPRG